MAQPLTRLDFKFQELGLLRDVLELIGRIREIDEPITSPEGLRQALEFILNFAELLGVSAEITDRLRRVLADENVFRIVLAIVRLLLGAAGAEAQDNKIRAFWDDGSEVLIDSNDFLDWLPIIIQIIDLLRMIIGGRPRGLVRCS